MSRPSAVEQADGERDVERQLVGLPGRAGRVLRDVERVRLRRRIVGAADADDGRAGLAVPPLELREVDARGVLHRLREVVAGDRHAVVALEVEVHAAPEPVGPQQRVLHADDLGALLVDGARVEIVDLEVLVGPHVVRERARVLGELLAAQVLDRGDALDGARVQVARELLVAEDGEAFLERQLEPVAARHAVAGPVVEVLVADHALDGRVVVVGRGGGIGEHQAAVEDVEALVLHRAHVEVVGAEDHERVEVVLAAEALFVPAEGALERRHRVMAAREVGGRRVDLQRDRAPRLRRERVLQRGQVARPRARTGTRAWETGRATSRSDARRPARPARPGCRWTGAPGTRSGPRAASPCSAPARPGGPGRT